MQFLGSSVVEQSAVNRSVGGSNPSRGANKFPKLLISLYKIKILQKDIKKYSTVFYNCFFEKLKKLTFVTFFTCLLTISLPGSLLT